MLDVLALTRRLIHFDTVSHNSNLACIQFLADQLVALGFQVEHHDASTSPQVKKINLIARRGEANPGTLSGLLLAGHSDTVPIRPGQKAGLDAFQEGGLLYGRGTCDMKGAIAAQLVAAASCVGQPLKKPLTLAYTCDEEIGCLGAKRLLGTSLLRSEVAIVGEPSSNKPIRMHKGYIGLNIIFTGKAAHSSDPRAGRSAIRGAARCIVALEQVEEDLQREGYDSDPTAFVPNCCTLNVGLVTGGVARNVIPETASFTVELRPLPGQDVERLTRRVEEVVRRVGQSAELQVEIQRITFDSPMETSADTSVVCFLEERSAARAGAVAFSTEGKEYNLMGMKTAIFGPGSISKAHQEDEFVPVDELEAAVDHYRAAIDHFCR